MDTTTVHLRSPDQHGGSMFLPRPRIGGVPEQEECPMLAPLFETASAAWAMFGALINNDADAGCQRKKKHDRDAFR